MKKDDGSSYRVSELAPTTRHLRKHWVQVVLVMMLVHEYEDSTTMFDTKYRRSDKGYHTSTGVSSYEVVNSVDTVPV